ncbi:serine/threonine-protein kinase [Streptomyces sp. CA-253872]|uniref:serine/threonine-protein kinase n=1 Tax=Streptomyces sp. CA-253872 TaxID=3240067 RepID=UPI003D8D247F
MTNDGGREQDNGQRPPTSYPLPPPRERGERERGEAAGGAVAGGGTGGPTAVEPEPAPLLGGRYRLLARLGDGGMGTVWRARDEVVEREVAVKEPRLPAHLTAGQLATAHDRMRREARAAARIDHPSVVTVHDVVEEGGRPWVVMELVRGPSLADRLSEGTLDPREAARIGRDVAAALEAAHRGGVLHRDVKPANILLAPGGRTVLTDFGIARIEGEESLTESGALIGSPEFMAPERVLGRHTEAPSDLWSLGVVLYLAVEGVSPFRRSHHAGTLQAVLSTEPPLPARAGGGLAPLLMRLLRKEPAARPTAAEVRAELDALATFAPGRLTERRQALARWLPPALAGSRRARWGTAGVALALVAALVLALVNPFASDDGALPEGWESRPEKDTLDATIAVPSSYHRVDHQNGNVVFFDPGNVYEIHFVETSVEKGSSRLTAAEWKDWYEDETDGAGLNAPSVSQPSGTYRGRKIIENVVEYDNGTLGSSSFDFRVRQHERIINDPVDERFYWRIYVTMPARGSATAGGEQLFQDVMKHFDARNWPAS